MVDTARIRGLFVTGTDTGVGKTVVTAALAAALRAEGMNLGIWKPVQCGALIGMGATDAERLLEIAGIDERPEMVAPYTFAASLTPMLAARQAGVELSLADLIAAGQPLAKRYAALLIEGAGGAAAPLAADVPVADLIAELRVPALIVARSGLGTINHTLLTVSFLRQRYIPIAGIVMNDGESANRHNDPTGDPSMNTNAQLIEQFSGVKVLGRFPRLPADADLETRIHTTRKTIDLMPIREALV